MASKSDKEKKDLKKSAPASKQTVAKPSAKKAKEEEDEDDDDDEVETPKPAKKNTKASSAKSKKKGDDDDDDDDDDMAEEDEVDEWDKVEEEEEWDPDFDEFDLPRSRAKKGSNPVGKKNKGGDEDDLGLDDDYKNLDLFNENNFDEEEDDF
jgi:hypothetical protein